MATTNIHKARVEAGGAPLTEDMIKPGLEIRAPSGLGGTCTYVCKSVTQDEAVFINPNRLPDDPEWAYTFRTKFNQPDLNLPEIAKLHDAYITYDRQNHLLSNDGRGLVSRAEQLGYVNIISHTQISLTDKGRKAFAMLPAVRLFVFRADDYDVKASSENSNVDFFSAPPDVRKGAKEAAADGALYEIYASGEKEPTAMELMAIEEAVQTVSYTMTGDLNSLRIVSTRRHSLNINPLWDDQSPEQRKQLIDYDHGDRRYFSVVLYRAHDYASDHKGFSDARDDGALCKVWKDDDNKGITLLPELTSIVNAAARCIDGNAKIRVGITSSIIEPIYQNDGGQEQSVFVDVEDVVSKKKHIIDELKAERLIDLSLVEQYATIASAERREQVNNIEKTMGKEHLHFIRHSVNAFFAAAKGDDKVSWASVIDLLADLSPPEIGTIEQVKDALKKTLPYELYSKIEGNPSIASDWRDTAKMDMMLNLHYVAVDSQTKLDKALEAQSIKSAPAPSLDEESQRPKIR